MATSAVPGQYLMVRCGEPPYPLLRRPLSIHRCNGDKIALLYNIAGLGTGLLSRIKPGQYIDVIGTLGKGFSLNNVRRPLLIAGGRGIAPLFFLCETALKSGRTVTLLYGARSSAELYPLDYLPAGIDTVVTTEDGSSGQRGLITNILTHYIVNADGIFACGPLEMYRTIYRQLKESPHLNLVQISLETTLGCGTGFCYGCTIPTSKGYKQVCKDGPVFKMADITWE